MNHTNDGSGWLILIWAIILIGSFMLSVFT